MSPRNREETLRRILDDGAIVAVRLGVDAIDGAAGLVDVCRAVARGGLRVLEVTLTTPHALKAIQVLSKDDAVVVGGGTVLTVEDVRSVAKAGGQFAFSPVVDTAVIEEAHRHGLVAVPGTSTPTEMLLAHRAGADLVKVFPSGPLGGADFLRKVRGPLPDIPLVPTSGPTAASLAEYLDAGAVAVGVGGEELFPSGFTLQHVETAAKRVHDAMDERR